MDCVILRGWDEVAAMWIKNQMAVCMILFGIREMMMMTRSGH